jgi:hypothetical protein
MNMDSELDVWRRQWQMNTDVPPDLRSKVERQSRYMKIALAVDILVTVVIGGGTIGLALRSPQPDMVLLAVATWLFLTAAWTFRLTVDRGGRSPSGLDTTAFVDFLVRRCRAALATIWFGAGLFVTEIAFCLGWVYHRTPPPRTPLLTWLFSNSLPIDIVWLSTLSLCGFLFWYRRKKRAELAYLQNLRDSLRQEMFC